MKRLLLACLLIAGGAAGETPPAHSRVILFVGDGLTEGFGVKPSESYPSLIVGKLAQGGWDFTVENQSRNGDTSSEALSRVTDRLDTAVDVLVVALGEN